MFASLLIHFAKLAPSALIRLFANWKTTARPSTMRRQLRSGRCTTRTAVTARCLMTTRTRTIRSGQSKQSHILALALRKLPREPLSDQLRRLSPPVVTLQITDDQSTLRNKTSGSPTSAAIFLHTCSIRRPSPNLPAQSEQRVRTASVDDLCRRCLHLARIRC